MEHPEVSTRGGRLRGKKEASIEGFDYYAFRGIPYAKPPLGELRFKDPVLPEPWTGTKDAFEFGQMCAQNDIITGDTSGSEDCLYLNVYAKKLEPNARRPVMVWIHGGGFSFGSGSNLFYGPDYLMEKDIVLVTINYRLGALGFLSLQDENASGNQGMKDQVMALEWIRDNIENFGGDSQNITTFGQSAGGAAVHYLAMSPMSRGLIHKAISQSGTALCPWATSVGDPKAKVYSLCQMLNIETRDHKEIVKRLQDVEVLQLVGAQTNLSMIEKNLTLFVPGSDKASAKPFLPLPPLEAAMQGVKLPYLLGHNNREGAFFYKLLEKVSSLIPGGVVQLHKDFHGNVPKILEEYNMTIKDLENVYSCDDSSTESNVEKLIDMHGDVDFVHGVHKAVRIQVERNLAPTYMYKFTYGEGHSFTKSLYGYNPSGASHLDDLFYMFSMGLLSNLRLQSFVRGTVSHTVMKRMVEMWTNFARFGKPTPKTTSLLPEIWQPVTNKSNFQCMNIGSKLQMSKTPNIEERFINKK